MKNFFRFFKKPVPWAKVIQWASWGSLENAALLAGVPLLPDSMTPPGARAGRRADHAASSSSHRCLAVGLGLVLAALGAGLAGAQDLAPDKQWIEQVSAGVDFPASSRLSNDFAVGVGSEITVGYRFNRDFVLSTSAGFYDCDQKGTGASGGE